MTWKFGQYIEKLLHKKGWRASELAKKAGLSHVYVGQLLRGANPDTGKPPKLSVDTLQAVAKALNVPDAKLFLAYKGIEPDTEDHSCAEEFDLKKEINLCIASGDLNLDGLTTLEKKHIEESIMALTRKFIVLMVECEVERLKKKSIDRETIGANYTENRH